MIIKEIKNKISDDWSEWSEKGALYKNSCHHAAYSVKHIPATLD